MFYTIYAWYSTPRDGRSNFQLLVAIWRSDSSIHPSISQKNSCHWFLGVIPKARQTDPKPLLIEKVIRPMHTKIRTLTPKSQTPLSMDGWERNLSTGRAALSKYNISQKQRKKKALAINSRHLNAADFLPTASACFQDLALHPITGYMHKDKFQNSPSSVLQMMIWENANIEFNRTLFLDWWGLNLSSVNWRRMVMSHCLECEDWVVICKLGSAELVGSRKGELGSKWRGWGGGGGEACWI